MGSSPGQVKSKIMKLVYADSQLSSPQYQGLRAKIGWLGIRLMCPLPLLSFQLTFSSFQWSFKVTS